MYRTELEFYNANQNMISCENLEFLNPCKIDDIYISRTKEEYTFKLSKIDEKYIEKDMNDSILKLTLTPSIKSHSAILEFFKSIDEKVITQSYTSSSEWFCKKINKSILEQLFIKTVSDTNTIHLSCDKNILNLITSDCNLIIKLHGIEFYKNNFMCNYQVIKCVEDRIETVSKVDFISYIENKGNLTQIINELEDDTILEDLDNTDKKEKDVDKKKSGDKIVNDNVEQEIVTINPGDKEEEKKDISSITTQEDDIYDINNIQKVK